MSTFNPSLPLDRHNRPPGGWQDPVTGLTHSGGGVWYHGETAVWGDGGILFCVPEVVYTDDPDHPQDLHSALLWMREHHPDVYAEVFPGGDPFEGEEGDDSPPPKPLDVKWTPGDLDDPPEGTPWWAVARDVLRAAGVAVDGHGDAFHPGGWMIGVYRVWWAPYGADDQAEMRPTGVLRSILTSDEVTVISDESRRRLLAWLDGEPGYGATADAEAPDPVEPCPDLRAELAEVTEERDEALAALDKAGFVSGSLRERVGGALTVLHVTGAYRDAADAALDAMKDERDRMREKRDALAARLAEVDARRARLNHALHSLVVADPGAAAAGLELVRLLLPEMYND